MANVKSRAKSKPNRTNQTKINKPTPPSPTEVLDKSMIVKKHELSELSLQLTTMDKVVMLLQNGHLMKDRFRKSTRPIIHEKLEKSKPPIHLTKSGEIKPKTKESLKLIDGLLKQELMIDVSKKKRGKEKKTKLYSGINNNVYERSDSNIAIEVSPRSSTSSNNSPDIIKDKSAATGNNNLPKPNCNTTKAKNKELLSSNTFCNNDTSKPFTAKDNSVSKRKKNMTQTVAPISCPNKRKCSLPQSNTNNIQGINKMLLQQNSTTDNSMDSSVKPISAATKRKLDQSKSHTVQVSKEDKIVSPWKPVLSSVLFTKPETRGEKLSRLTDWVSIPKEDQSDPITVTKSVEQSNFRITIKYQNPAFSESDADTKEKSNTKAVSLPNENKKGRPKKKLPEVKKKITKNSSKKIAKPKQVKLSNGVVLTLTLFQCDYCEKVFSNKSSLRRHIYQHLGLKPYQCNRCRKRFQRRTSLRKHVLNKHSTKEPEPACYTCVECGKPFLLLENLCLHLTSHVKKESVQCVYCEKKFSHNILLAQHEKQHLIAGRFQCSICNMNYDCRSRLALHVKSHLNIKDYVCQYCGKEFLRANSIRRHVEICHGGFRVECPICNKKLRGHLAEHLRLHEKNRPHTCPECGQSFTQSTQLRVHRRSHTGDRPYMCRICKNAFAHSSALSMHVRRHTGEKPFPCALCPMFFSQLPHMKTHMKRIHGKEDAYKCEKCDEFFKLKLQLESHMKLCNVVEQPPLTFEQQIQASIQPEIPAVESAMNISRMRFLLALLLTMIASKEKLKYLGFNKRLIDDLLVDSLKAMGHKPCTDKTLTPLKKLKNNIEILLKGTVPSDQLDKFRQENRSTEEILELLTKEEK